MFLIDAEDAHLLVKYNWHYTNSGYLHASVCGKLTYLHHLLLPIGRGECVDHINGNKLDNRRVNLRLANKSKNAANYLRPLGKHKYRGIMQTNSGKFAAQLTCRRIKYNGTSRITAKEAATDYNRLAKEHFGDFARLNVVE